jgi:hypothetical protein
VTPSDRRRIAARVAIAAVSSLVLTGLGTFGRGSVPATDGSRKASVSWTAVDATSGRPVSREEWIAKALALHGRTGQPPSPVVRAAE